MPTHCVVFYYLCIIQSLMHMKTQKAAKDAALNMRLPADLLERAKLHAESKGLSLAGLVRMLLIQDMEPKPTDTKEASK
jgi:predicted DNA binding CopG/RHH family protein